MVQFPPVNVTFSIVTGMLPIRFGSRSIMRSLPSVCLMMVFEDVPVPTIERL